MSACPVCRKNTFAKDASADRWQCASCGFAQSDAEALFGTPALQGLPGWISDLFSTPETPQGAELLHIGCGDGKALAQAEAMGLAVMGVEADEALRQQARQRLPGVFIADSIESLPPHHFAFVLLTGVLENEPDPYAPFHALFTKAVIVPETIVLVELLRTPSARNDYTIQALTFLFRLLGFQDCKITEATASDGAASLRGVVRGSHFTSFMQERYVPGTWSALTDYEHLPRYDYASHLAVGGEVLDFGCGTGYGARKLATTARRVVAVDIDEPALAYARATHTAENLEFLRNADLGASLAAGRFDLITCFEVIEHISAAQQAELVSNFAKLLKPDGLLLMSTPNPAVTALYGQNPYHLHEMRLDEFRALAAGAFAHVRMFSQTISAAVALFAQEPCAQETFTWNAELFPGNHNVAVYIAACGHSPLPPLPPVIYLDNSHDFISGHIDMLRNKNVIALERLRLTGFEHETRILRQKLAAFEREQQALDVRRRQAVETAQGRQQEVHAQAEHLRQCLEEMDVRRMQAVETAQRRQQEAHAQAEHLRHRLEQIEHSTSWRALRRAQPMLAALRPVLRPPVRFGYRLWRRFNIQTLSPLPLAGAVTPVWQKRNLMLEMRLEPVWNESARRYDLHYDKQAPAQKPDGWVEPYHVVPYHRGTPAAKRVLHIIPNVFVGGSTQLVIDLIQNVPRAWEHVILTSALWQGGAHTGVQVHHVPQPDPTILAQVLDELRPDMVHMHYWGLSDEPWYKAALEALRGRALPAVQNVNTPIAPLVDPMFQAYVFVSHYVLNVFGGTARASGAAVEVIHPGINLNLFESQDFAADAPNAIGMVYRLEQDKLNEDSIDLLIEVVRRRPRTHAYVVGGGSLLQPYLERTEEAGVRENFRFTGYVPYESLPSWYEKFRVFVAPVWKESFGQVAPFAMSKGCAVAGYDIGALAEICGGYETLGHDPDEVAGIIVDLLDNPEQLQQIGAANHRRAQEMFGLAKMIERYTAVYDRLIPE